jgi:hypothetical protein
MCRLSRRDVIVAMATMATVGMPPRAESVEDSAMYFVPGGRIGFQCPATIKPLTSSWHLLSTDQTLQVEVREALRIDPDWDNRIWQPGRQALLASGFLSPGIEHRHFRNQRYGNDANYGADTHALRDDHWIGQITLSTSTLGSQPLAIPGGQIARWQGVTQALLASLTVRPPLPASDALVELGIYLDLEGLNPRLVGDQLVLSLAPPTTPLDASGVTGSRISLFRLSLRSLGRLEERAQATDEAFTIYQKQPGSRIITGSRCRALVLPEKQPTDADDPFSINVMAFGATRRIELTAHYKAGERDRVMRAIERIVSSLSLPDDRP